MHALMNGYVANTHIIFNELDYYKKAARLRDVPCACRATYVAGSAAATEEVKSTQIKKSKYYRFVLFFTRRNENKKYNQYLIRSLLHYPKRPQNVT